MPEVAQMDFELERSADTPRPVDWF